MPPLQTPGVCGPLTAALGLPIVTLTTPFAEGTGGLYLYKSQDSDKFYLLTVHHVVFQIQEVPNKLYHHTQTSQCHCEVTVPGSSAFQAILRSTMGKIGEDKVMVNQYNEQLDSLQMRETNGGDDGIEEEKMVVEGNLKLTNTSIKALYQFHKNVRMYWNEDS
jgi:hypothetical protein